uniref:Insulin-like growth factor binding protein 3 n=1 Tax=Paramormyrops kingsleyae TaxID=1676925 RepID=A0A3B3S4W7_9TELE
MSRLCLLCLATAFAILTRLAEAVGPVVRCEPCDAGALGQCKPLPKDCAEAVREPGCGCCMTCALTEGQPCGVYTGRCGSGLTCQYQPGESRPLQALLEGRGVCSRSASKKLNSILIPVHKQGRQWGPISITVLVDLSDPLLGAASLCYIYEEVAAANTDTCKKKKNCHLRTQFSSMMQCSDAPLPPPSQGPCRREMDSVLNSLKITNVLNPKGFRIPNCDKKGFYKKKQCRPSKGRKRGSCWCVDKYGQSLPGYSGMERSDAHCYNLESK